MAALYFNTIACIFFIKYVFCYNTLVRDQTEFVTDLLLTFNEQVVDVDNRVLHESKIINSCLMSINIFGNHNIISLINFISTTRVKKAHGIY